MASLVDSETEGRLRTVRKSKLEGVRCRISQAYLPASYLPTSCKDSTETYYQWAWSLTNTVLVGATTIFNTTALLAVVFLWLVNRQFHFKKKHSYDKKPLQPLERPAKVLRRASTSLRQVTKKVRSKKGETVSTAEGDPITNEAKILAEQTKYKSFQTFLDDFDEGGDEFFGSSLADSKKNLAAPETRAKKKRTKDLLTLASKIEAFSYLSSDALGEILEYVEYVDFKDAGDVVFDGETLDGSMYALISGEVTTSLSIQDPTNDNGHRTDADSTLDFSFVAGPGEVITSLLTLITSLVREYQAQDASTLLSELTGVLGGRTMMDRHEVAPVDSKIAIPPGMNVKATVTRPDTRLLRIPSRCFVAVLKRNPNDVYHICQTIVARLQRVTIQTLLRFLGLEAGIVGMSKNCSSTASSRCMVPEKKPRNTTKEWNEFQQSRSEESNTMPTTSSAIAVAASLLGLSPKDSHELAEGTSIVHAPPGAFVGGKEEPNAIYLILEGALEVGLEKNVATGQTRPSTSDRSERRKAWRTKQPSSRLISTANQDWKSSFEPLFIATPGNFCGLSSCFTRSNFIAARNCAEDSAMLLKISANTLESIVSRHPRVLVRCLLDIFDTIGDGANLCVSPPMFLLDMSLDWMHVEAGESIAVKGEPCDSIFVVLNGRLRAESSTNDSKYQQYHKEYGRGATIGELEALAEENWAHNVSAVRHCEVARIPSRIIHILMRIFPTAGLHFAKVIAKQIQKRLGNKPLNSELSLLPSYDLSLATIAVVPLTEEVDVGNICSNLVDSLTSIAPTKLLTKSDTTKRVGEEFFKQRNKMLKVKMTRILGDDEENNRLVVYQSECKYTWWSKLCIQQADVVLLLVDSRNAPELQRVEELLDWANKVKNVRIELVVIQSLLSQEISPLVSSWSEKRAWISKHHLIRCSFAEDFSRMSRRITGCSIGLVMGGGGARGLSHLGVIKALNEAGIAVDMVGGTSQGAFMGALLARNPDDYDLLVESVQDFAAAMSSISNKMRDLTFPLTSYFSGHYFNMGIQRILKNARIQDFVLNFFCVSVDISNNCQMVHTKGLAWKYVRASMGLTGYLPPISEDNRLLVDGGYMNVVPADVMSDMGAKRIIAVDVSAEKKTHFYDYGTELSGLWLLWNSWNPFVQTVKVPSMGDISERLSWVSSEVTRKDNIKNKVDLFLRPPVGQFGTLEYDKIDEIVNIGYEYAKPLIEEWAEENGL